MFRRRSTTRSRRKNAGGSLRYHFRLPVPAGSPLGSHCSSMRHALGDAHHHLFGPVNHRKPTQNNVCDRLHAFCSDDGLKPILEPTKILRNQGTDAVAVSGVDSQGGLLPLDVNTTDASYTTSLDLHGSIGAIGRETEKWTRTRGALTPLHSPLCRLRSSFRVVGDCPLLGSSSWLRGLVAAGSITSCKDPHSGLATGSV